MEKIKVYHVYVDWHHEGVFDASMFTDYDAAYRHALELRGGREWGEISQSTVWIDEYLGQGVELALVKREKFELEFQEGCKMAVIRFVIIPGDQAWTKIPLSSM